MYSDIDELKSTEQKCPIDRCKVPLTYIFEQPLLRLGDWALKLVVVLGFAFAGWLFWKLLNYAQALSEFQCTAATILFILLPINGARVGLSTARSSYLLPVFLLGALFLTYRKAVLSGMGYLLVLYAGFWPSYQIYVVAIMALLATHDRFVRGSISRRTWLVAVWLAFVPFIHRYFLEDLMVELGFSGAPGSYNSIRSTFLIRAVLVCGLLSAPFIISLIRVLRRQKSLLNWNPKLSSVGMFLLALGTFPYMAVGHFANLSDWVTPWLPDNSDWDSRHQLLQGPGFAIIITSMLISLVNLQRRNSSLLTIVAISVALSVGTYSNYHVDGLKQRDVISDLQAAAPEFDGVLLISFRDQSIDLNARGRKIRDYEWKGLAEKALQKPISIWEESAPKKGCRAQVLGKTVTVRKTSGRLIATLTRRRVASIEITDLVACR
jgi:hypothetical protein